MTVTVGFKDHFSTQSEAYARYRPGYPDELFAYLAALAPGQDCAWDCATGNGQAALSLTKYFNQVYASDASKKQLRNSVRHSKIRYFVSKCEASGLPANSCDLITVAQALHWFDFDAFFAECRRIAKKDAILAAWCYNLFSIDKTIENIVANFYSEVVGPFWPPERRLIEENYRTIPFPFQKENTPDFHITVNWAFNDFIGYLNSWSATQRYINKHQRNPVNTLKDALGNAWGAKNRRREIRWPLQMLVGRIHG